MIGNIFGKINRQTKIIMLQTDHDYNNTQTESHFLFVLFFSVKSERASSFKSQFIFHTFFFFFRSGRKGIVKCWIWGGVGSGEWFTIYILLWTRVVYIKYWINRALSVRVSLQWLSPSVWCEGADRRRPVGADDIWRVWCHRQSHTSTPQPCSFFQSQGHNGRACAQTFPLSARLAWRILWNG